MDQELEVLKGIHPGIIVDRKIKERNLSKGRFSLLIKEYPQTFEKIDWLRQKRAVIQRVFERGNNIEKGEITRFYGEEEIRRFIEKTTQRNG